MLGRAPTELLCATEDTAASGSYHRREMRSARRHEATRSIAAGTGWTRPAAAVVLVLTFGLVLAACGSGSSSTGSEFLSTTQTKAAIEASILEKRHVHATVVCPPEVVREKGVRFECVATTPNGVKTIFRVVEANDRGYVEYSSVPEKKETATKSTSAPTTRRKKP